ncbi:hypothetical protein B0H16DRAFT_1513019 [Mycena metata]|uniref:F-box domain-containing protein n=1 Tax=Mycena metata TaxID=1033252 RepID=A0AAD7JV64_9AGAR|nr:hypothetical protein B0H16DRAFT_1513019 [Mycena metata]
MPPQFMALPTELLDVVASHVPVHDLPALCRANHRLYDVCLRWIYHTLSPATVARAVEIFKVLVSNEVAGAFVKVFIIRLRFDGVFKSFTRLMAKALINLTSLESLNCSFSPRVFSSLSLTSFPRLLDCKIPFCADAVVFLRLHPTLVKLRLIPDFSLARPTYSSSPISLPVLREFSGPAWAAREIVPHSSIEVVTLAWNESFPETYHIVLNGFSGIQQPLRVMNNLVFTWDPVFLLAIAKHLPRLAVCNIWKMVTAWPGDNTLEAFYDALKTAILDLTHLVIFSCTLICRCLRIGIPFGSLADVHTCQQYDVAPWRGELLVSPRSR